MRTCAAFFRQYWDNLQNFFRRHPYLGVLLVTAIAVGLFSIPHTVFAADPAAAGPASLNFSDQIILAFTRFFLWVAGLFIELAIFFLKFFILLAGYNGFINASVVKFGWNIVRDVANMFFIVILLVIAFGTILGLEQYEWKKSLPKLVFAAIFVNFSNVICQLIIDVSQVFTITFLNAVAGTAGGNFINMMNFSSVLKMAHDKPSASADLQGDLIIGALFAMFMCMVAAAAIGSYLLVMLFRMVTLWCLIILSPLAFLFSVLPTTQSYADEFWKEFVNHVIAAPMMVFFLWLAFSTFGAGNVVDSLQGKGNNSLETYKLDNEENAVVGQTGVSINEAASWMNLANFAVAIGFLFIGMERVQKLGVRGGDYIDRAKGFATKAFTIAAGIDLARHAHGKAGGVTGILGSTVKGLGKGFAKLPGPKFAIHKGRMGIEKLKRDYYNSKWLGGADTLRYKGELDASQHATEALKERLVSEGHRNSSAHHTAAEENVKLATEKRRAENESKELEASIKLETIKDEEKIYEQRKKDALAALGTKPPTDRQLADIQLAAKEGLTTLEAMAAEGLANRQIGKATKRDNSVLSELRDAQRVNLDNKKRKYRKDFEEKDWREDMEDFAHSDYDERFEDVEIEYKKLQTLKAKKAALPPGGKLTKEENDQMEVATKNLMQLTASAFENDEGNFLLNKIGSLNPAWAGKTINAENEHEALLSLWTAEDQTGRGHSAEKSLRDTYGKDWNLLGRNVMRSMNAAASRNGNEQDRAQILKGKDVNGLDTFGFANNMDLAGNLGNSAGILATGSPPPTAPPGTVLHPGSTKRAGKESYGRGSKTVGAYKDPMSLLEVRAGDFKAMRVRKDAKSQQAIDSLMSATANDLRGISASMWYMLSGGDTDNPGKYNIGDNDIKFEAAQADLKATVNRIIDQKRKNYTDAVAAGAAVSSTTRDKLKEDALTFARLLTKDATFDEARFFGTGTHAGRAFKIS